MEATSVNQYEALDKGIHNPTSVYTTLDKTVTKQLHNPDSVNQYKSLEESTHIPTSVYTTLDRPAAETGNPEGPPPEEQTGSVSSRHVETTENSKKVNNSPLKTRGISPTYVIALVVAVVLLIAAGIAIIIAFVEISKLRSEVAVLQSTSPKETLNIQALESTIDNNTRIIKILATILDEQQVFVSCAAVQKLLPLSPSGHYNIRSSSGFIINAYCDMTRSCGGMTGGWMRVAELDMTDNTTQCPDSLELRTIPLRTCTTVNTGGGTCSSDMFSVNGIQYSEVCGRIKAYQVGSPDAFGSGITNINNIYVDGVSLTHGNSPRQHIWTFASADNEDDQRPSFKCPCTNTAISDMAQLPPSFVGDDYFCDTALDTGNVGGVFYSDDPLWDGAGCGPQSTCCSFNSPPWFYKQLPQTTTDDIEMRVCHNGLRANEVTAIEIVELYVQ